VDGQAGTADILLFNGANVNEVMAANPGAVGRVTFVRDVANVIMDVGNTTEQIVVNALGGDDSVTGSAGIAPVVLVVDGGDGNDTITGGDANDTLTGGPGNDSLIGGAGNDSMSGGLDQDTLLGGAGADSMSGGSGFDSLVGGDGNDTMLGDENDDVMVWNPGDDDDTIEGGSGNADEVLFNGANVDEIMAINPSVTPGRITFTRNVANVTIDIGTIDRIRVNALGGNDNVSGAVGIAPVSLIVDGGTGNDTLTGGDGNDTLLGGDDNDSIVGARGNDSMAGGGGDDTMVWNNGDGSDTTDGDAGTDRTIVNGSSTQGDVFTIVRNGDRLDFDRTNFGQFSIDISTIEALEVNGDGGDDSMTAQPSLAAEYFLNGGAGTDSITVDRTGAGVPLQSGTPANGQFTFTAFEPINITNFETLSIIPSVCAPKPNLGLQVFPDTPGRLRVVVSALVSEGTTANSVQEIRFTSFSNGVVDVPNGPQNQSAPFTLPITPNTTQVTFFVRRVTAGQGTTVQLTAKDQCGELPTFVGGGPNAF
jgi:Ca2+-binding RTX toxin-like protein